MHIPVHILLKRQGNLRGNQVVKYQLPGID